MITKALKYISIISLLFCGSCKNERSVDILGYAQALGKMNTSLLHYRAFSGKDSTLLQSAEQMYSSTEYSDTMIAAVTPSGETYYLYMIQIDIKRNSDLEYEWSVHNAGGSPVRMIISSDSISFIEYAGTKSFYSAIPRYIVVGESYFNGGLRFLGKETLKIANKDYGECIVFESKYTDSILKKDITTRLWFHKKYFFIKVITSISGMNYSVQFLDKHYLNSGQ